MLDAEKLSKVQTTGSTQAEKAVEYIEFLIEGIKGLEYKPWLKDTITHYLAREMKISMEEARAFVLSWWDSKFSKSI